MNYAEGYPAPVFSSFEIAKQHALEVTIRGAMPCFPIEVTDSFLIPTLLIE